ncbi:MAG: DUF2157 domain-containing protein [Cyanobacteria bacterium P01_A01_bin.84]
MSSKSERPIHIELKLYGGHPRLLKGLDIWLRLGLISDGQVRHICRESLTCKVLDLPLPVEEMQLKIPEPELVLNSPAVSGNQKNRETSATPGLIGSVLQSLLAELSVRWLLFLGMFLVVLSSGVLAASQWERFPASGQYSVLWAYTLTFWGVSFWAGKQENLKLTAGSLLVVTLLLIPINFWAIDSFKLWHHPIDWVVVTFSSISLSFITNSLCNHRLFTKYLPVRKLYFVNLIGLSYLNFGWELPGLPLLAVYIASIGTSTMTVLQVIQRHNLRKTTEEGELNISEAGSESDSKNTNTRTKLELGLPVAVVIYSLLLILARAVFVVGVDVTQLGLAVGICGCLIAWLGLRSQGEREEDKQTNKVSELETSFTFPWQLIGGILIFLGWLVSFNNHPEQAFAISGLGIWFFYTRLQRYSLRADLAVIFFAGLQSLWLGWNLVPIHLRTQIVNIAANLTNTNYQPDYWLLFSLAIFPYIIAFVGFSDKLHLSGKTRLAEFSELLNLSLGLLLTTISLLHPTLRSLNLLLSTITLIIVSIRYTFKYSKQSSPEFSQVPQSSPTDTMVVDRSQRNISRSLFADTKVSLLPYLTNIATISTICSWINLYLPNLRLFHYWATILLILMVAEWLFSVGDGVWRRSAWHIGFGLALVSFILLWGRESIDLSNYYVNYYAGFTNSNWRLTWFATPITLAVISTRTHGQISKANRWSSVVTVCIAQLLTFPFNNIRLIGLGIAAGLMYLNTGYLKDKFTPFLTVGFSLSFLGILIWKAFPYLSIENWLLITSVTIFSLWGLHKVLSKVLSSRNHQSGNYQLIDSYAKAINVWTILLCVLEIFALSSYTTLNYIGFTQPNFICLIATIITLSAIFFHSWNSPKTWKFYGIAWCLELIVTQGLSFGEATTIRIAIANIFLGLITQFFGAWWKRKHNLTTLPPRWNILPLIYGLFGVLLRSGTFAHWTGLSSLLVSFIVIGIGRRNHKLKPLLYLGLVGVSVSAYELLIYQISQASGNSFGDAFIVMAVLGAGIMSAYQILSPLLRSYLGLSSLEIKTISHIHWGLSSALVLGALNTPVGQNSLAFGVGLVLVRYAIFQGKVLATPTSFKQVESKQVESTESKSRKQPKYLQADDFWVYLGLIEAGLISLYLLETPIGRLSTGILRPWQAAIACVAAYFFYILPWSKWGWSKQPWHNVSYILPLIFIYFTSLEIYPITLILVAGFYVFLAIIGKKFRFTYISLILFNWALWRSLIELQVTDIQWYVSLIGLSLLYIAQFDPYLKLPESRESRHIIRSLAIGIVCGWATIFHQDNALIPGIFSIIAIFAGLALRIRAFLYVGTAAFFATGFYQLVLYIGRNPFIKWIVGLILGIMFIAIAANFENRRTQISSLLRNTSNQLKRWE